MGLTLSPQQQSVAEFAENESGSLILSARAGTGKTTTLLEILSRLDGATLLCAFNKSIISEIEFKISKKTDIPEGSVRVSTVHAVGMRVWGKHIEPKRCKVDGMKIHSMVQTKVDRGVEIFMLYNGLITKLVNLAKSAGFGVLCRVNDKGRWLDLIEHFGVDTDSGIPLESALWYGIIDACILTYQKSLELCLTGDIDYSDQLLAPLYYKAKFPQYSNVLIDEAQDISPLRLKLLLSCLKPDGRVIAVGDPYQAIYGFTGADDQSLSTIKERVSAKELPLTVTRRCPKAVVTYVQQWVPDITAHDEAPEGLVVTVDLKPDPTGAMQRVTFWDCGPFTEKDVIICRNTKPLVELAYQFIRKRQPCKIEGRNIGEGLITMATRWKSCKTLNELEIKLSEWLKEEIAKLKKMKQDYKAEDVEDKTETLLVLIDAARNEGGEMVTDVVKLINDLFETTPAGTMPKCVTLSTVHKSKGREWPRVFLLGRNRYMPSKFARQPWELQQEKNLMYVAATRAMKELIEVNVPLK